MSIHVLVSNVFNIDDFIPVFKLVLYFGTYAGVTALPGQCLLNTTLSLTHSLHESLIYPSSVLLD